MFAQHLGTRSIKVSVEELTGNSRFNAKIVFHDIEPLLRQKGYSILRRVRKDNSLAVLTKELHIIDFKINVDIRIVELREKKDHFNAMVVFDGLVQELQKRGINILQSEKTENERGSSLALRYYLVESAKTSR